MRVRQLAAIGVLLVTGMAMPALSSAGTREYWLAADEIEWDYAPTGTNLMQGRAFNDDENVFVGSSAEVGLPVIGRTYRKAVYQQYTSNWGAVIDGPSVRDPVSDSPAAHLGLLGPVIRAEVGDTIVIHFRNNASFPASVHPHGVFYDKASEGAPYTDSDDNLTNTAPLDDRVPPGGTHTYTWGVPERAGPGPADPSSIGWVYHSHANETADTNAGLVGPMVISAKGKARPDGSPKDVQREFFSLFTVFNENASRLFEFNASRAGIDPAAHPDPELFEESNLMHGINGLVWGHNRGYVMNRGENVRWYILGMGTEVDLHTPHWHAATLLHHGARLDVAEVLPAATKTFDMVPDNPGTWMFHCHVNDHIEAGMMTKFTVR